jgi:uncharacterized tellurite resistance protein B-like protein
MLKRIQSFFDQHLLLDPDGDQGDTEHDLRLAVGALLLEMTRMDGEVGADEREVVEQAVSTCFALTEEETAELLELAEAERAGSTDYYQFTSLINGSYTPEQKIRLIETLWRIAFADEGLHRYEEHLVRKVSDLLYISHRDFIAAKHRVRGDV